MRRSGFKVMTKLISLVKPLTHIMLLAITSGILGYLSAIFITILGGFGILNALGYETIFNLKTIIIIIISLGILRALFRYLEQLSNHFIAFKILAIIRNKVFSALRKLAPAKLEGKDKGNLISIITSDIELLEVFYAHTISPVAIALLTSTVMILFIFKYHWLLSLIALVAYFVLGIAIPLLSSKMGNEVGLKYRNLFGSINSFILGSLRGLREIIQFNNGSKRTKQLNMHGNELSNLNKDLKKYEGLTSTFTNFSVLFFSGLMLFAAINLYNRGLVSFSGVLIPTIAIFSSFGPVIALSSLSNNLRHTIASGNRVLDLLEEEPLVNEVNDSINIKYEDLKCECVNFSYEKELIIKDFNLAINKNTIVGIKGKSGVGKSTLLKLIMRFWDIDSGFIKISNQEIKTINTKSLRENISYITQDTYLFNDTILNNIKIANPNATIDEVISAAKKASIHDFIISLPNKYETNVGELGDNFSSGERQRIGLARAFIHGSPLILLDEPTSNLDSLNEAIILKSLLQEKNNKTMILVSHRDTTMNITDVTYEINSDDKR